MRLFCARILLLVCSASFLGGTAPAAPQHSYLSTAGAGLSPVEIICLLIAGLSLATAVVCYLRMRRMEYRLRSFRESGPVSEHYPPPSDFDKTPAADAADTPEDPDSESYAPYESDRMDYDRIFLQHLDELIAENITNHAMDVDFLAEKMMISRSLLFSRVKRITGVSVTKYVNAYRIERSVEMLAQPQLSLTEIAESTGFSTLRYYSRVFKSIKGEIPSAYRERILGSGNESR